MLPLTPLGTELPTSDIVQNTYLYLLTYYRTLFRYLFIIEFLGGYIKVYIGVYVINI